jgi:DNA-directed RNA polymerase subunit M/transcription elongation factor TFIIS
MNKSENQNKLENPKSDVYDSTCPNCKSDKVLKQPRRKEEYFDVFVCFECDYSWDNKVAYLINPGICE